MIRLVAMASALFLFAAAIYARHLYRRSDNPATILNFTWSVVLALYSLMGDAFYDVQLSTIFLFLAAALALFLGCLCAGVDGYPGVNIDITDFGRRSELYSIYLWALILLSFLPMYYELQVGENEIPDGLNLIAAIRVYSNEADGQVRNFSIVRNLQPISLILPLAYFLVCNRGQVNKLVGVLLVLLAMAYGLFTGSKAIVPVLGVTLCVVAVYRNRGQLRGSGYEPILIGGALGFIVLIRFVNLAYEDRTELELLFISIKSAVAYVVSPVVAFNTYTINPERFDLSGQNLLSPLIYIYTSIFNAIGVRNMNNFPIIHAPFTPPGPDFSNDSYNTFSYLIGYYQVIGPIGVPIMVFVVGYVIAIIYRIGLRGNIVMQLTYIYLTRALVLSFNGENILGDVANIFKFWVAAYIVIILTPKVLNFFLSDV